MPKAGADFRNRSNLIGAVWGRGYVMRDPAQLGGRAATAAGALRPAAGMLAA